MNDSFSLQQKIETGIFDSILISRKYKLNLLADFMRIKYENSKLKQSQIANQLSYSTSTLQRYRNNINLLSSYRIQPNKINKRTKKTLKTNSDNTSNGNHHVKNLV